MHCGRRNRASEKVFHDQLPGFPSSSVKTEKVCYLESPIHFTRSDDSRASNMSSSPEPLMTPPASASDLQEAVRNHETVPEILVAEDSVARWRHFTIKICLLGCSEPSVVFAVPETVVASWSQFQSILEEISGQSYTDGRFTDLAGTNLYSLPKLYAAFIACALKGVIWHQTLARLPVESIPNQAQHDMSHAASQMRFDTEEICRSHDYRAYRSMPPPPSWNFVNIKTEDQERGVSHDLAVRRQGQRESSEDWVYCPSATAYRRY